ncbi:MAG: hypothetical protein GWO24_14660, partial [Akkermansiaceae bacterium]|nr:hypothetical protein [Akkermansiaceae bacterium]
ITVYRLDPSFDATKELREFFETERSRRIRKMFSFPVWQRTAYAVIESAGNMSETIEEVSAWTRTRLPRVGRSYGQGITRLESGITLGLAYSKVLFYLAGFLVLVAGLLSGSGLLGPGLGTSWFFGGFAWLPVGVISLVAGLLAGRISRR